MHAAMDAPGSPPSTPALVACTSSWAVAASSRNRRRNTREERPGTFPYTAGMNIVEAITLAGGFTTVQSAGAPADKDLREAISRGVLPGPRILSSLGSMNERTGEPEAMRAYVQKQKAEGADFIKIFASKSIRGGGAQTMTDAQLAAPPAHRGVHNPAVHEPRATNARRAATRSASPEWEPSRCRNRQR